MLKIFDEFAPRANVANSSYPHGHGKNESVVDANDGTPLTMKWYDDQLGFSEALIAFAGITPNGNADTALVSDRMDAFKIATCRIETATAYNDGDVTTVGLIATGVDVTSYLYMVDPDTLTRWLVDGVTGTFAGDFNASTGVDSGLSSTLTELKAITESRIESIENNKVLTFDNFARFQRRVTSGASGGSTSVGLNDIEITNTISNNISGVSLASNSITLPAGDYYVEGSVISVAANGTRASFYNETTMSTDIVGMSMYESAGATYGGSRIKFEGVINVASTSVFSVKLWCNSAYVDGLGLPLTDGNPEIYTDVKIWKL